MTQLSYATFEIVELMPNTLDDKNLEYIKIKNNSETPESLEGYIIEDLSGKRYIFTEEVFSANEEKIFYRSQTKIILNNSNEEVFLYNTGSILIHKVCYKNSIKSEAITELSCQEEISGGTNEEENAEGTLLFPELVFDLQQPSYITQSGSSDTYICDLEKDECKVNFDLRPSFKGEFSESDYICEISFGTGMITGQEEKCNPNTVVFPEGRHEVKFKIRDENNSASFTGKTIKILHFNSEEILTYSTPQAITILSPKIIVQSGLLGQGRYFYCKKEICTINLKYEKRHENEACRWRFYPGVYVSKTTRDRCNPGYVTFSEGIFELSLLVYEDGNSSNKKKKRFYIYNTPETREKIHQEKVVHVQAWKKGSKKEKGPQDMGTQHTKLRDIDTTIILQGKLSENKALSGNTLICTNVEQCYVNLIGNIDAGGSEIYKYVWTHNGEEFFRGINPKGIWVQENSSIELKVFQNEKEVGNKIFSVVLDKVQELKSIKKGEPLLFESKKKNKKKSYKKHFTQNFLPLKYDGLRISGKAPIGSLIEIYTGDTKIISGYSDDQGKYRLVTKHFSPGEYSLSTKIMTHSGVLLHEDNISLSGEDILHWYKKSSTRRSNTNTLKQKELHIEYSTLRKEKTEEGKDDGFRMHILLCLSIFLVGLFGASHLLFVFSHYNSGNFIPIKHQTNGSE